MADDTERKEHAVLRAIGGPVSALAAMALFLLLFVVLPTDFGRSTGVEPGAEPLAAVTFIVGGMMKARSGAT